MMMLVYSPRSIGIRDAQHLLHMMLRSEQRTHVRDGDGGLGFIPRDHPHVETCALQSLHSLRDAFLQLVLDAHRAQQLQLLLNGMSALREQLTATRDAVTRILRISICLFQL